MPLPCNQLLPTQSGWTTIDQIEVGDVVFNNQGMRVNVEGVSRVRQVNNCFKVMFDDGTSLTVGPDHIWLSYTKRVRKSMGRKDIPFPPEWTTTEVIATTLRYRDESMHAIPIAMPAQYSSRSVLIDPYVLGVWLGDGTSAGTSITSADPEILVEIRSAGYSVSESTTGNGCHF